MFLSFIIFIGSFEIWLKEVKTWIRNRDSFDRRQFITWKFGKEHLLGNDVFIFISSFFWIQELLWLFWVESGNSLFLKKYWKFFLKGIEMYESTHTSNTFSVRFGFFLYFCIIAFKVTFRISFLHTEWKLNWHTPSWKIRFSLR